MRRIWLGIICLVALFLNIYGIWGGIPSEDRLKLIFSNKQDVEKLSQVMKEARDEIYQTMEYYGGPPDIQDIRYKIVVEGKEVEMPKWLINSIRSFLLRSNYPDEQAVLASLGNMNPQKLDFNPHFFEYGGLYIYLVGAGLKIASIFNFLTISPDISYYFLHPDEMGKFFIVGRLLGALMGVLAVYIIYLLASRLYNRRVGLISALLMSFVPVVVVFSHYLKPYVFNLPFLLLSFYMAVKILDSDKISNYIWGGIFAGLAGGILIPFGLIFVSIPTAHLIKRISQNPKISAILSIFEKGIILSIISSIVVFIIINPYMLVSIKEVLNEFRFLSNCHPFNPAFGHSLYFFRVSLAQAFGWPLLAVVSIGTLYSLYKREKTDILILSFIFLAYFYISATTYRSVHYGIWIIPFLILLGARLIGIGLERGRTTRYITLTILLVVSVYTFLYSLSYDRIFAEEDIRVKCGKWLLTNIEPGASIGYFRAPTPFAAPLVNPFRYKIRWWQEEEKNLSSDLPQYFVYAKECDPIPEEIKPVLKSQYQEIKRFEKIPEVFGIEFKNGEEYSGVWNRLNSVISIYKRRSFR